MKRILCPVDFSETAINAIAYAAKFAKATRASLTLFNVQSLFEVNHIQSMRGKAMAIAAAREELEKLSETTARVFKVSCDAQLQPSNATLSKVIAAQAEDYDLVIMGTSGPDGLYEFFTGSNTYKVIKKCSLPVLLLPADCGYSEINNITYAFDYLHERTLPLKQLNDWMSKYENSRLRVLQIIKGDATAQKEEELKEVQDMLKTIDKSGMNYTFETLYTNNVRESIDSYIYKNEIDLLALCARHHDFIESIFHKSMIKQISAIATYPVFVFHQF